jgi:hypothetical protein
VLGDIEEINGFAGQMTEYVAKLQNLSQTIE